MTTSIIIPMTADEARDCITAIREHMRASDEQHNLARQKAFELGERAGWKALGYKSFYACAKAEFGLSYQHVYRLRDAAAIEGELNTFSPEAKIQLPETHARKLKSLPTPESRYEALKSAEQMASSEGSDVVAARHIDKAVQVTATKIRLLNSRYAPLSHMVATGTLSVELGEEIAWRIDKLAPTTRGYVLQHLVRAGGVISGAVVTFVGEQYQRKDDPLSVEIIAVLDRSGCLGDTPLKNANMTDARRALYEARLITQTVEPDNYGPVTLTLWQRDIGKSLEALQSMMGPAWMEALRKQLIDDQMKGQVK